MEEKMLYASMEFKDVNLEERTIEGFASTPQIDLQNDIVLPTAFEESFRKNPNPVVVYNHNIKEPIGRVIEHRITDAGLWVKILISKTADKVWTMIKEGILTAFSFGFFTGKGDTRTTPDGVRVIQNMNLVEVSVVGVPANSGAQILAVSNAKGVDFLQIKDAINTVALEMKTQKQQQAFQGIVTVVLQLSQQLEADQRYYEKVLKVLEGVR